MRLAIIADIHGNLSALEAVAADIARRGVDQVVNLGDIASGPLFPLEVTQYIMALSWTSIAGNHERQLLAPDPSIYGASDAFAASQLSSVELAWMRTLPPTVRVADDLLLCHGTPTSDHDFFLDTVQDGGTRVATSHEVVERLGDVRESVVVCGHSHIPRMIRTRSGQLLINPGSVGLQAFHDTYPEPYTVQSGAPDARYAIIERVGTAWRAHFLAVPYGHLAMTVLARRRGRLDWAEALETGYVS